MDILSQMRVVDEVDNAMSGFSKNDFDIVFDFITDELGCLFLYDNTLENEQDKIDDKLHSIFSKYGAKVSTSWDCNVEWDNSRICEVEIKVVSKNGQS